MQGLMMALCWMTSLPVAQSKLSGDLSKVAVWLPFTGFVVGLFVCLVAYVASTIDPWLGASLGVVAWLLLTGGLHADGLADLTDAYAASHADPERFIVVLKDPHIGSFGVLALICMVMLKVVLLKLLIDSALWWALWLVPVWARLGILFWARLPSLTNGSAAAIACHDMLSQAFFWAIALVILSLFIAPILIWALPLIFVWYYFLKSRLKGMNGDCLGAGVEGMEIALLFSLLF